MMKKNMKLKRFWIKENIMEKFNISSNGKDTHYLMPRGNLNPTSTALN